MAGEQSPAIQLRCKASSVGILITLDQAPLVLEHLNNDPSGVGTFRLLCKRTRDIVDRDLVTVLRVRAAAAAGTDSATQLRLACGMLARGTCRRLRELKLTLPESEEETVPHVAEQLFRSVPCNPNPNPPPITKLTVSLRLLTPEAARAVGAALPGLEELVVPCDGIDRRVDGSMNWRTLDLTAALTVAKQQQAALGLAVLLGPSSAAARPLLPALRRLELGPNLEERTLALAAALGAATQLRSLRLHLDLSYSTAPACLSRLSGMTQLDTLELASPDAHRPPGYTYPQEAVTGFAAALAPLGGTLRSLAVSFKGSDYIYASCFTTLRSLQELRLGDAAVHASSLSGLTSLTRLHAGDVWLTAEERREAGTRFRLPPQLRALPISWQHTVEALAALEPLPSLAEVAVGVGDAPGGSGSVEVCMRLGLPTSVDADGRLLPAGEEALCRTAALLSGADTLELLPAACAGGEMPPLLLPLLPPSHPAPGFEGHGRWLSAWGANKLRALVLWDVALTTADLATIARWMPSLQSLVLAGCSFPVEALMALAALPLLSKLNLAWYQGTELPAGLEEALQELRARAGPRLLASDWYIQGLRTQNESVAWRPC